MLVAINYFTKWIEVLLGQIIGQSNWNFLWKNIICHFSILREITSDNEMQFESKEVRNYVRN